MASLLCLTLLTSITGSQWSVSWRRSLVKSWSKGSLPELWRAQPLESTGVMALFPMEHPALNYWELSYGPPTFQQQKVDLAYSFLMKNTEHKRILQPLFGRDWGAWWCMYLFFSVVLKCCDKILELIVSINKSTFFAESAKRYVNSQRVAGLWIRTKFQQWLLSKIQ